MNATTDPANVFVTGATGFIGTRLVNELVHRGHRVRALSRPAANRTGLAHQSIEIVPGDILDRDSLRRGMAGCSQAYHLAAYARNWAPSREDYFRHNVEGMKNVFDAAAALGVQRVVFTSTIVSFGPTAPGTVGSETMPRLTTRHYTEYEESKTVAEQAALEYARGGFPVVIVNPTRVYGPGKLTEGNSVSLMIDRIDRGRLPVLLNKGVNVGNYVLVDDLVRGHILAMERGRIGERYILGGENASLERIYRLIEEVSGKRHFRVGLPPAVALSYAKMEQAMARWFGIHPKITPGWVETFLQEWAFSCAKAEQELGYTITPLREGVRITYRWILEERKKRK
jgi:nucleoside-diphosphate-sugar epimerase